MNRSRTGAATCALAVGILSTLLGLSGCSLESVPMPSAVSGPSYTVTARFRDALNLPEGAPVKLDGSLIGQVDRIRVRDYVALVTLRLRRGTPVPRGSTAQVRTTAPMGEAYVELDPPDGGTDGGEALGDGDVLPLRATTTAPDVTDLLVALSATVTGGPFADISTIVKQLGVALDGRSGDVQTLLQRLDRLVRGLNAHRRDLDRVLDGMDGLASSLAADAPVIARGIDDLAPAVRTLRRQRADLVRLLGQMSRLSRASRKVVVASRTSLVRQVREVGPVLQTLIDNQDQMRPLLQGVLDFGRALDSASPGDYARFELTALLAPGDVSNLVPRGARTGLPGLPTGGRG